MKLNDFFQRVFLINLDRREDRLKESTDEANRNDLTVHRFPGYDHPTSGHEGCTRSHRMLLREIADGPWERVLVLEDDFACVTRARLKLAGFKESQDVWKTHASVLNGEGNLNHRFNCLVPFLPLEWDVLFLGASYAETPIIRFNRHVIQCAGMKGTGSVGVTRKFAQRFTAKADADTGGDLDKWVGPIDDYYSSFSRDGLHFCLQPRLIYQRKSPSDIDGGNNDRLFDHTDAAHEQMV